MRQGKKRNSQPKNTYRASQDNKTVESAPEDSLVVLDTLQKKARQQQKKRFVFDKLLGTGGLCEIFSATDLLRLEWGDASPFVAIKRLLPEYAANPLARQILAKEFFIMQHLAHANIVRAYDLHDTVQGLCFTLELLHGKRLHDKLGDIYTKEELLELARKLFETVSFLHAHGIAHGDIKPANLILENGKRLVLYDFNSAEILATSGGQSSSVARGIWSELQLPAFSVLHASPERISGRQASFADDVYATCCTFYEIATGEHPYKRKTSVEAQKAGMEQPTLAFLSWQQRRVLRMGLSFDSTKRPTAVRLCKVFSTTMGGIL